MPLARDARAIWIEVLVIYAIVIAAIGAFKLLSFVPFIAENLWGIAGLLFLFVPLEYLHHKGADLEAFGLTWKHLGRGVLWAVIWMAITFPLYVPAYKWWFSRQSFHFALPGDFWMEVVGFFLLVALPEEVFYRGYMQSRLDGVFKGRVRILGAEVGWSLIVTSVLFALGHLVTFRWDRLGTFFPSLVFGWIRARTGSIAGAVIFHAMCNIWAQVLRYGYFGTG